MTALLVGLAVGTTIGVVATLVLVVDPMRRERRVFRDRIVREQMRTFAMEGRLIAERYVRDATPMNVTPIRVVPEQNITF